MNTAHKLTPQEVKRMLSQYDQLPLITNQKRRYQDDVDYLLRAYGVSRSCLQHHLDKRKKECPHL